MPAEPTETRKPPLRMKLAPEKGNELVGWLLLALGLLIALSLGSYDPRDPSFLHRLPGPDESREPDRQVRRRVLGAGCAVPGADRAAACRPSC